MQQEINYKEYYEAVKRGYILYAKENEVRTKRTPNFGTITLTFQDGNLVLLETKETEK